MPRPRTRADCRGGPRPCPWVGCRFHLYLDVKPSGAIRFAFPDREPGGLQESCAIDVADGREHTLDELGELLNVSHEQARAIVADALESARRAFVAVGVV